MPISITPKDALHGLNAFRFLIVFTFTIYHYNYQDTDCCDTCVKQVHLHFMNSSFQNNQYNLPIVLHFNNFLTHNNDR